MPRGFSLLCPHVERLYPNKIAIVENPHWTTYPVGICILYQYKIIPFGNQTNEFSDRKDLLFFKIRPSNGSNCTGHL